MQRGFLLFCLLLAACASGPEPEVRVADPVKTIVIRSWPSGLVIELNGEYIGITPVELVVNTTRFGVWPAEYSRGFSPIVMRASTPDAAGWEQRFGIPATAFPRASSFAYLRSCQLARAASSCA